MIGSGPAGRRAAVQAAKLHKRSPSSRGGATSRRRTRCSSATTRRRTAGDAEKVVIGTAREPAHLAGGPEALGVPALGIHATEVDHIDQAMIPPGGTVDFLAEAYKVAALDAVDKLRAVGSLSHR